MKTVHVWTVETGARYNVLTLAEALNRLGEMAQVAWDRDLGHIEFREPLMFQYTTDRPIMVWDSRCDVVTDDNCHARYCEFLPSGMEFWCPIRVHQPYHGAVTAEFFLTSILWKTLKDAQPK